MSARLSFDETSRLGFGSYRVVAGNPTHRAALGAALGRGCTLIDTACSYSHGASESLIGEVLASHPRSADAFIVTKVGYITHAAEPRLRAAGVDVSLLPAISDESRYGLSVDVLRAELSASLERLGRARHDAVLLHNPEHLFELEQSPDAHARRQQTIVSAFEYLEDRCAAGLLECYGVSSNVLASGAYPSIDEWAELARRVSSDNHFRIVQFPFNLLEREAADKCDGVSLIGRIRALGLRSMANRPLTSQRSGALVRLASAQVGNHHVRPSDIDTEYEACLDQLRVQLVALGIEHQPMDFMVMQFLRDNRHGVDHPELVDAIFDRHVHPFVEHLWQDRTSAGPRAFSRLHLSLRKAAARKVQDRADQLRRELVEEGVIARLDHRDLALIACEFALSSGIDRVVVGAREPRYVESLSSLFTGERSVADARHLS